MNIQFKNSDLVLTPIVTPFVVNNDSEFIKMLMEANGNQPLISQEESMRRFGIKDPNAMIEQINGENTSRNELNNATQFNQ